jgi:hypothetical protein
VSYATYIMADDVIEPEKGSFSVDIETVPVLSPKKSPIMDAVVGEYADWGDFETMTQPESDHTPNLPGVETNGRGELIEKDERGRTYSVHKSGLFVYDEGQFNKVSIEEMHSKHPILLVNKSPASTLGSGALISTQKKFRTVKAGGKLGLELTRKNVKKK